MRGIVLAGPTGVGKTDLSIKLAKLLDADIISSDSAQVYKEMNIGTAKIREDEMQGVKHYMLDVVPPIEKYSVGEYQRAVDNILNEKEKEGKAVIITGGTGLYINSVVNGLSALPESDPKLRDELMELSTEELYEKLKSLDVEASKTIHMNNKKRVERAVEVCLMTNEKFSVLSKKNVKNNNYDFLKVCLTRDRETLYKRIDMRVEIMMEQGLLEEVKYLYEKYGGEILRKINIIGYTQLIDYLEGRISLETAIEYIKRDSRRYAKRQMTWFNNDDGYLWFDLENQSENEILKSIMEHYLKNV
ncbi:tRNA (adenosine(37)-N6)-dimethylallyltransferase MiaA [Fusobacterium sp.]|uniref:tRNA (adenosine(37)-N6)-dimethylallyltransferase MiaA n=1 Tax=Fusobacterium sp. TaxID=68766 RepID=UPI002609DBF8|nr:tRNA (adenosine(37)-N6)-dimethylallyltransferase MiaA [Fusobacterium sp.]